MKTVTKLFALLLVFPSFAFAVKIKDVDIVPGKPKVGDTVLITVKTDKNAAKVEIDFPAIPGPPVKMQDKDNDKWQIKLKMSTTGEKKFKVTAFDKKGKKDSEEKKFQVGAVEAAKPKSQPAPTPVVSNSSSTGLKPWQQTVLNKVQRLENEMYFHPGGNTCVNGKGYTWCYAFAREMVGVSFFL